MHAAVVHYYDLKKGGVAGVTVTVTFHVTVTIDIDIDIDIDVDVVSVFIPLKVFSGSESCGGTLIVENAKAKGL